MWKDILNFDPLPALLQSDDLVLKRILQQDLLGEKPVGKPESLDLPGFKRLLSSQLPNGSWQFKGKKPGELIGESYELLETWRNLRVLVDVFCLNIDEAIVEKAAEFIFGFQTDEGDIRGILGNQYMPYYMGAMLETLIHAGYTDDPRIEAGFKWLEMMRQKDGGWIIPMEMFKIKETYALYQKAPIQPNRDLPFSHLATGMVLRAYATHPFWRHSQTALKAAALMEGRLFKKDAFPYRGNIDFWFKFQYPFWWTNLLTVLDAIISINNPKESEDVKKGVRWFIDNQATDGTWKATYNTFPGCNPDLWVSMAICRMLKKYYELENIKAGIN